MNVATIGERLQLLRGGMSQTALAELLGLSRSSLVRYERGERQPDAELLERICRVLGVNGHWLLTGIGPMREAAGSLPPAQAAAAPASGSLSASWEQIGSLRAAALGLGQLAEVARLGPHAGPFIVLRTLEDGGSRGSSEKEIAERVGQSGKLFSPAEIRSFLTFLAKSGLITERTTEDGVHLYSPARRSQVLMGVDLAAVDELGLTLIEELLRTIIPAAEAGRGKVVCSTVQVPAGRGRELGREILATIQQKWQAESEGPNGGERVTLLLGVGVEPAAVVTSNPSKAGDPDPER